VPVTPLAKSLRGPSDVRDVLAAHVLVARLEVERVRRVVLGRRGRAGGARLGVGGRGVEEGVVLVGGREALQRESASGDSAVERRRRRRAASREREGRTWMWCVSERTQEMTVPVMLAPRRNAYSACHRWIALTPAEAVPIMLRAIIATRYMWARAS